MGKDALNQSRTRNVQLQLTKPLEIGGVTLPAGTYSGKCTEIGVPYQGQTQWQPPEYEIEVHESTGDWQSWTDDVTAFVRSGQIRVI
jgi:hypothetical protein